MFASTQQRLLYLNEIALPLIKEFLLVKEIHFKEGNHGRKREPYDTISSGVCIWRGCSISGLLSCGGDYRYAVLKGKDSLNGFIALKKGFHPELYFDPIFGSYRV